MPTERNEKGQYTSTVRDEDILAAVRAGDDPIVTATEIAERVGCSREKARDVLAIFHNENVIDRRTVGGRAVVWWLTDPEADTVSAHEQAFEAFAERLTAACGEAIEEIILYGSVARGDHREHSDVDILIIIEDESARERVQEHTATIGFEIMLEHDVLVAENITTRETFNARKDGTYLSAVRRDGRTYA